MKPAGRPHTDRYEHCAGWFDELNALPGTDEVQRERLRRKLIEEHLPLAEHIAQRFSGRGEPRDDLVQVARLGLVKAVDRFDPDRANDFLAFAVPTVMGEVRRYFRDAGWSIRVPRRLKELHLSVAHATATLSQQYGHAPSRSDVAEHLDLAPEEVTEALVAGNAYRTSSLDCALPDEPETPAPADFLGEDDIEFERAEIHEVLQPMLRRLPDRERAIIAMRFFGNMTQSKIAERIGLSQMHVSRLLAQSLEQLRKMLDATPAGR
ncbi:RNA polymerase sigma-28 (SigD/FliA/WhiG) subunit [Amycolatopsis sulphurea]|uniref:RNA polymerase sigma-28 (SigD/FliA/WhiG) subunit n=1 Tax=Amycolatopsis sulphurea TaxID=76022 RepID=A0A2A9G3B6_9PSEU|nr:RNA polymerase sigma factor SigF [Amycolatopsis sulphurea]PFG57300.1 RNA polymerase sigma-28 (SigD/FliA/WhiG) subunit [Amycolatopsis sulphurea]